MAGSGQSDKPIELPSLPPVETGDFSLSTTEQADAGATRTDEEPGQSQSAQNDDQQLVAAVQPPSEPALSGETHPLSHLPPPITIPPAAVTRRGSEAIGPSTDLPTPLLQVSQSAIANQGPVIQFTLLLASTGTRHPYQINEKYLSKRNVKAKADDGTFDPSTISIYTLKELILKDWRDDWDPKPSSPSTIRLIYFGQLLADNASLKDCKFNLEGVPNVLHVTVRPQEAIEDEDAGKSKNSMVRDREGSGPSGCRCVIL